MSMAPEAGSIEIGAIMLAPSTILLLLLRSVHAATHEESHPFVPKVFT